MIRKMRREAMETWRHRNLNLRSERINRSLEDGVQIRERRENKDRSTEKRNRRVDQEIKRKGWRIRGGDAERMEIKEKKCGQRRD